MEYDNLYELAKTCDKICEVGVQRGNNFKKLIEHNPSLAVAVDHWMPEHTYTIRPDGHLVGNKHTQEETDGWYENLKKEMANKPFIKICRGFAHEVVRQFEDETFDLVYIDADHVYESVSQDIADWYPKVKAGGYLCGHDYIENKIRKDGKNTEFGVIRAVDEFVKNNDIETFFILKKPFSAWGLIK
jgi:predicted O-methyltransferase YrrM